ncbi:MAG TPA: hypothetical protein PL033_08790 [Candidatus Brocadiia bacterium]|nr:hypothetical protein [Candidatus Brocadiia bacterium]
MQQVRYAIKYCKGCQHKIEIPETLAGRYMRCENCGREVRCPSPGSSKYNTVRINRKVYIAGGVIAGVLLLFLIISALFDNKDERYEKAQKRCAEIEEMIAKGENDDAIAAFKKLQKKYGDSDDPRVRNLIKSKEKLVPKEEEY